MMRAFSTAVFAGLLLSAAPICSQDTTATDPASGMIYPTSVGAYQRISVERGPDGALAAVYRKGSDNLTIAVSVFKTSTTFVMLGMPKSREDMNKAYCMDGIQRVANQNAGNVVQTAETNATLRRGSNSRDGFVRSYNLTRSEFVGTKNATLHTDIYRFCFIQDVWTIQYRVDFLPGMEPTNDVKAFMKEFDWSLIGKS